MPASLITPRRLAIIGVSVLSLVACCGLAWWQWERFSSANGTFQNLGYVLQWPLFGLFPAFMFYRIRKLRGQAEEAEAAAAGEAPVPVPKRVQPPKPAPTPGEDDELVAYNRYLAELNARDEQSR